MYYVYVLYSKKVNKFYKGYSNDLKKRIFEHNNDKVRSTKFGKPWELIYYEAFIDKTDARREELFLKTGKGREKLKLKLKIYLERCLSG